MSFTDRSNALLRRKRLPASGERKVVVCVATYARPTFSRATNGAGFMVAHGARATSSFAVIATAKARPLSRYGKDALQNLTARNIGH